MQYPRTATLIGAPTLLIVLGWLGKWMAMKETYVIEGWHLGLHVPSDLRVYLLAGEKLNAGGLLYDAPLLGDLPFTYPPFAAGLFRWLATLTPDLATIIWQFANLLALIAVILLCFRERGREFTLPVVAVGIMLAVGSFATEPIRGSFFYGQINLLLLLLVAMDLLPRNNRWAGIGIGLAAGLKLTPAFFIIVFLVQRNYRAAALTVGTFLATVLAGFLIVPDALRFWTHAMFQSDRVGVHENPGAQSLKSILVRNAGTDSTLLWLLLALLVTALTAAAAWLALRRGNHTVAMALTGIGACLVSPFSWFHHWFWIIPLVVAIITAIADRVDVHHNWWLSQAGAALTVVVVFVVLMPYVSGVLWPPIAYAGPWFITNNAVWQLAFTGYGLLMIVGYLAYAGFAERNALISPTKRAGSAS